MRGLTVPDTSEDFAADQVELFFDLAFVFAFSQLVGYLIDNHTPGGVARGALIFMLLWLPWTQFTWSANAVSSSARVVRVLFLVATVASVPMAASVQSAFDDGGPVFAISASVILAMGLFAMVSGTETGSEPWRSAVSYSIPNYLAIVILVTGSFLAETPRIVLWCLGLAVVIAGTLRAGGKEWIVRSGHFAERHGLIIIVALGEVIVAVGIPVVAALNDDQDLPARTIVSLLASGTFAGLLWWSYFDRPAPAFEYRSERLDRLQRGQFARDVYTYAHAPVVAGIILSAAALEEITLHPEDPLEPAFAWMLLIGLVMFLGGVGIAVARAFRVVAKERIVSALVIAAVLAATGSVDGVIVLVIIDVVLFLMLVAEQIRVEGTPEAQVA